MIITVVLLVIGFVILLYVFLQLGLFGASDKNICHQSVILRGTTPAFAGLKSYAPLSCKTEKVCVTSKLIGGECLEFAGEPGVTTVRVSSKTELEKYLTQNFFDCWSMMGEGKVSVFAQWLAEEYGFGKVYPSCVVCSRIAFDSASLESSGIKASEVDVEKYMQTHYMPGKTITYSDYLGGNGGKIIPLAANPAAPEPSTSEPSAQEPSTPSTQEGEEVPTSDFAQAIEGLTPEQSGDLTGEIQLAEQKPLDFKKDTLGVIFTQISAPSAKDAFKNLFYTATCILGAGASVAPGTFFNIAKSTVSLETIKQAPAGGIKVGEVFFKGGRFLPKEAWTKSLKISGFAKAVAAIAVVTEIVQQVNVAYDKSVAAGYCGDISTGDEAREGCSAVREVKYNATDLNSYCSVIESSP